MRNAGKHRAAIELDEVKEEDVYEEVDEIIVNKETYDDLETEIKTKTDNTSEKNIDKTKVAIVVFCAFVTALLVAVFAVGSIEYFGATDGGWTSWGDWGTCSVTCGGGLSARQRTCSNPQPSSMGKYCEGTSEQMKICNKIPCSVKDGGWTSWGNWGTCSETCGGGFITRLRTCSNPQTSSMGKYCKGISEQMKMCNNILCSATDGGWTSWGDWGTCSVRCGGGLSARSRTCSNPQPSSMGKYCEGTPEQMKICNNIPCSGSAVGFSVYHPDTSSNGNPLIFQKEAYNVDNVFNMASGMFVCRQEGFYYFVNTVIRLDTNKSWIRCNFYKNDIKSSYVSGLADSTNTGNYPSGTNSILYYLKPGDNVYLGSCQGVSSMSHSTSFTGFLVTPVY